MMFINQSKDKAVTKKGNRFTERFVEVKGVTM